MLVRTSGSLGALAVSLALAASCTNGGIGSDFGVGPSDEVPTDIGAPGEGTEPPGNDQDPPFGDVAPGDPNGVPGDTPLQPADCKPLCRKLVDGGCLDDAVECERQCLALPAACSGPLVAAIECIAAVGCEGALSFGDRGPANFDGCRSELESYSRCIGPEIDDDPDPPGGGGQGGI